MRRTAMAVVGLVLAGWGAGLLHAQDAFNVPGGSSRQIERAGDSGRRSGSASIRGAVTAAATGAPVRGATVRALFASGDLSPVTAMTNDDGTFELHGLVAGDWRVSASKSGFVPRSFGQRGPSDSGTAITLKDREQTFAGIALIRGGALMGHVFDEFGDPAVGTRVQAMQFVATEDGRRLTPAGVPDITDDTGAFRIYGLMPGDYLVSARAPTQFDGDSFVVAERAIVRERINDRLLELTTRPGAFRTPRATASTYFPGTADVSGADRVTIGAGDERGGIDFALTRAILLRVAGRIVNSAGGQPRVQPMISLTSDSLDPNPTFALGRAANADGTFDFRDVPPGSYRFTVSTSGPEGRPEMADVPLRVTEDLTGLDIVTTPGVALTGTVVADGSAAAPPMRGMLFVARAVSGRRPMFPSTSGAVIDGAFQVPNLLGTFRLAIDRVPAGWIVKAIEVDGVDVTDSTVTFSTGRPHATVVLTNRITELSGLISDDDRRPIDAAVAIFPDDPVKWTSSRFVRSLRAGSDGTFSLKGLPPHGSYLAIATDYFADGELQNPEFLEQIRSRATSFSLEEGQPRRITLTFIERSAIDGR